MKFCPINVNSCAMLLLKSKDLCWGQAKTNIIVAYFDFSIRPHLYGFDKIFLHDTQSDERKHLLKLF